MTAVSLDPLDLASLLCSRVCHDVVSPVGAIINGLEVLDEEEDPEMRTFALDLIKKSAERASAKLQFCRLAFGAAGSAGASIDTGDAEQVVRGLLEEPKMKIEWHIPRQLMPKNQVKLMLNLCIIGAAAIPRGGVLDVRLVRQGEDPVIILQATGISPRMPHHAAELLKGILPTDQILDSHGIQPYYTGLIAQASKMEIALNIQPEMIRLEAHMIKTQPEFDLNMGVISETFENSFA